MVSLCDPFTSPVLLINNKGVMLSCDSAQRLLLYQRMKLQGLNEGNEFLSVCFSLLCYIGICEGKLSVEREGLDVLHTTAISSGKYRSRENLT